MTRLKEFVINTQANIVVSLRDEWRSAAVVEADRHDWSDAFWIARCFVRPTHRARGLGTRIMTKLCKLLDERKAKAYLIPNPYDSSIDEDRLIAFYERFGFVYNGDVWVRAARAANDATRKVSAAS